MSAGKRIDSLRIGSVFAFASRTWRYDGKNRGAGGLSNVTAGSDGSKTILPASTLVRIVEAKRAAKSAKTKANKPAAKKAKVRR